MHVSLESLSKCVKLISEQFGPAPERWRLSPKIGATASLSTISLALLVTPFTLAQPTKSIDFKNVAEIREKVKSNILYTEKGVHPGNPSASFAIRLFPNGEIMSVEKIKNSGIPEYDDAIERAIWKSSPLPQKEDGTVERALVLDFWLKNSP